MSIYKIFPINNSCLYFCAGQMFAIGVFFFWAGIECSSLQDSPDTLSPFCPNGWFKAQNFCLARAQGESEKGVAMYCDSFGGIGVKGFCIIRAQRSPDDPRGSIKESSLAPLSKSLASTDLLLRLLKRPMVYRFVKGQKRSYADRNLVDLYDGTQSDVTSRDADESGENSVTGSTGVCPVGWYHHRLLCIYKPLPIEKQCHEMGATEFHGLCIKHADVKTSDMSNFENHSQNSKRVCCCAHPSARANKYAC